MARHGRAPRRQHGREAGTGTPRGGSPHRTAGGQRHYVRPHGARQPPTAGGGARGRMPQRRGHGPRAHERFLGDVAGRRRLARLRAARRARDGPAEQADQLLHGRKAGRRVDASHRNRGGAHREGRGGQARRARRPRRDLRGRQGPQRRPGAGPGSRRLGLDDVFVAQVSFASEALAFSTVPERRTLRRQFGTDVPAQDDRWRRGITSDRGLDWDFETVTGHYVHRLFGIHAAELAADDLDLLLDLRRARPSRTR